MPANPLAAIHLELGASLAERAGTPVPVRYGDSVAEHRAVRATVGVFDLTSAGKLWITGAERIRFLQGVLAADVAALAPGSGTYSLLLTRDGRIASDLRVAVLADRVLLLTPPISRGKVQRTLERHVVAADVVVEDATESWTLLSAQGPMSPTLVSAVLGLPAPALAPWGVARAVTAKYGPVVVVRSPRTGEDGLDLLVPAGSAPDLFRALVLAARGAGGLPCGIEALDALRIETGRPAFGVEMDETTVPVEMPEAAHGLALAKGCFLGREEAARSLAAAAPLRRLVGFSFAGATPAVRGDKLKLGGRPVGKITSSCFSPALERAIGLGVVETAAAAVGTDLDTSDGERATVVRLPFVAPRTP